MHRRLLSALAASAVLTTACVDRSAGPLGPRGGDAPPLPTASVVTAPSAIEPAATVLAGGALEDALTRVVPTLEPGAARDELAGALGGLDAALGSGDAALGAAAVARARGALDAAAGTGAAAELSAIELAVDRAAALVTVVSVVTP